jgi:hypothetical protein
MQNSLPNIPWQGPPINNSDVVRRYDAYLIISGNLIPFSVDEIPNLVKSNSEM